VKSSPDSLLLLYSVYRKLSRGKTKNSTLSALLNECGELSTEKDRQIALLLLSRHEASRKQQVAIEPMLGRLGQEGLKKLMRDCLEHWANSADAPIPAVLNKLLQKL
jgi:hypothetical protein